MNILKMTVYPLVLLTMLNTGYAYMPDADMAASAPEAPTTAAAPATADTQQQQQQTKTETSTTSVVDPMMKTFDSSALQPATAPSTTAATSDTTQAAAQNPSTTTDASSTAVKASADNTQVQPQSPQSAQQQASGSSVQVTFPTSANTPAAAAPRSVSSIMPVSPISAGETVTLSYQGGAPEIYTVTLSSSIIPVSPGSSQPDSISFQVKDAAGILYNVLISFGTVNGQLQQQSVIMVPSQVQNPAPPAPPSPAPPPSPVAPRSVSSIMPVSPISAGETVTLSYQGGAPATYTVTLSSSIIPVSPGSSQPDSISFQVKDAAGILYNVLISFGMVNGQLQQQSVIMTRSLQNPPASPSPTP